MKLLDHLTPAGRRGLFLGLLALTLAIYAIFYFLDQPLRTAAAPYGTVSYELAGSPAAAQAMIDSWDPRARLFAAFGLGFDFLFMPAYALTFALACWMAAGKHGGRFGKLGPWLAWGMLPAALCDALENLGLWIGLSAGPSAPWPQIAAGCATVKFALLGLALVYALAGWVWPKKN